METERSATDSIVYIVDDDAGTRNALEELFLSVGRPTNIFATALDFLELANPDMSGCLLSDIRLPQLGGLELQERLASHDCTLPVIFMSGHADIPMTVRGLKAGALDFLLKPLRHQDVLAATDAAIEADRMARAQAAQSGHIRTHYATLSSREKQVISLVLAGKKNWEAAEALDLSEITVKIHRGNGMRKVGARNVQDLVRMDRLLDFAISACHSPPEGLDGESRLYL